MKVRFGAFQIDSETRQLSGLKGEIHLSPKSFELLSVLVASRPKALSKAELQEHLWPSTFVSEANLPLLISEVRAALGDSTRAPRFIRTVPRFGYAFCAAGFDADNAAATPSGSWCFLMVGSDRVPLEEGVTVIGRDPEADVTVNVSGVSRLHARIRVSGVGVTVEDLDSKNGTFLKGQRLTGVSAVTDGDEIRLGLFPLTFRTASESTTTETQQSSGTTPDGFATRR